MYLGQGLFRSKNYRSGRQTDRLTHTTNRLLYLDHKVISSTFYIIFSLFYFILIFDLMSLLSNESICYHLHIHHSFY